MTTTEEEFETADEALEALFDSNHLPSATDELLASLQQQIRLMLVGAIAEKASTDTKYFLVGLLSAIAELIEIRAEQTSNGRSNTGKS